MVRGSKKVWARTYWMQANGFDLHQPRRQLHICSLSLFRPAKQRLVENLTFQGEHRSATIPGVTVPLDWIEDILVEAVKKECFEVRKKLKRKICNL